ncbi:hypothetical protein [Vibrio harveyi]|uniref:hypothetical protein n=1 Tax=Vibrio harveyi TaxID=669 RepID=UPI0025B10AF5|nr:hypothetical protein [Vibrio harveyi]WJT10875.1 hypothetical protein PH545_27915 [Vibrio harveyi]
MAEKLHNEVDETQDDVERGLPSVNKQNKPKGGVYQKIIVGLVGIVVVLALVAVNGGFSSETESQQVDIKSNDEIGNRLYSAPAFYRRRRHRQRQKRSLNLKHQILFKLVRLRRHHRLNM